MGKPRTPAQIRTTLREVEADRKRGATLVQACKKADISPSTYHRWTRRYMPPTRGRRRTSRGKAVTAPEVSRKSVELQAPRGAWLLTLRKVMSGAISFTDGAYGVLQERVIQTLQDVVAQVPSTAERRHRDPSARCEVIIQKAAARAARTSGSLGIPLGPLAIFTIIPDLVFVWKIQAQMVADVAGVFGKKGTLTREHLLFCLFKHAASQVLRDAAVRAANRLLMREGSFRLIRRALGRASLPVIGALGGAAYAYFDTMQVGRTAVGLFKWGLRPN